jgi:hypothetical protein
LLFHGRTPVGKELFPAIYHDKSLISIKLRKYPALPHIAASLVSKEIPDEAIAAQALTLCECWVLGTDVVAGADLRHAFILWL